MIVNGIILINMNSVGASSRSIQTDLLFNSPDIVKVKSRKILFRDVPNVDMDKMLVVSGRTAKVGTDSLSACFAICTRGTTNERSPVLSLWHKSPLDQNLKRGYAILTNRMEEQKCLKRTMETFVVGGLGPNPDDEDDVNSLDEERQILEMVDHWNIRGALFNYAESEDDPLAVVFTPEKLYVSRHELFTSDSDSYAGVPVRP